MEVPYPTPIYHITHVANLPSIIAQGELICCSIAKSRKLSYRNIADPKIQDRPSTHRVISSPGGMLHDYVPFYFAPRSPMLYRISHKGEDYPDGQEPIVHLVSTAQSTVERYRRCLYTDGHATMNLSDEYSDLDHLDRIDWAIMQEKYWANTPDDGDRKRRRQAEFLVYRAFDWNLVDEIGVINDSMMNEVRTAIGWATRRPTVTVRREWYY